MGVFKEHAHAFETVAKNQRAIFNDACDCGYSYNTKNIPKDIKDLIFFVNDLKDLGLMRKREIIGAYKDGVVITFRIGWEIDEGMECGTQYKISFIRLNPKHPSLIQKGMDAYIEVEIKNYREPHDNL